MIIFTADPFKQSRPGTEACKGRRFIRESVVPRVLLISYHDFLYRTETVAPLISRFLGLEFDESVTAGSGDEVLQSGRVRRGETPGSEKRSLIQKHANGVAEAWVLYRASEATSS